MSLSQIQSRLWHQLLRFHGGDGVPEDLDFLATSRYPIKRDVGWKDHGTVSIQASVLGTLRATFKVRQNTEAGGGEAAGCAQMVEGGGQMCKEDRCGRSRT